MGKDIPVYVYWFPNLKIKQTCVVYVHAPKDQWLSRSRFTRMCLHVYTVL